MQAYIMSRFLLQPRNFISIVRQRKKRVSVQTFLANYLMQIIQLFLTINQQLSIIKINLYIQQLIEMETYTVQDFAKLIRDKHDFYEALRRNGYFLPSFKSSIITESYLLDVMKGNTYCPKVEDIRLKACPRPPPKLLLIDKLLDALKSKQIAQHGVDKAHTPDKQWLIALLSTLKPNDEIFNKDYLPPPRKNLIAQKKVIQVPREFLKGLPESKSKAKKRKLKIIGEGLAKQKISYMKQVIRELNEAILEQEIKVENIKMKTLDLSKPHSNSTLNYQSPQRDSSKKQEQSNRTSILNSSGSQPQANTSKSPNRNK